MLSTRFGGGPPDSGNETFGFRVAYVPEPTSVELFGASAARGPHSYSIAIGAVEKQEIIHALQILELGKASRTTTSTVSGSYCSIGPRKTARCRQLSYRQASYVRPLRIEALAARVMLTTYYWDPPAGTTTFTLGHGKRLLDDDAKYPRQPHDVAKY